MTGQPQPKYRTDDIRKSIGVLLASYPAILVIKASIVVVFVALFLRSFGVGGSFVTSIVSWCTGLFVIETSLLMISQRVSFFGSLRNVVLFLIVGIALFTPIKSVLMLRLYPILRDGIGERRLPKPVALALTPGWLIACLAGIALDYVLARDGACSGWPDCFRTAFSLALS